MAKGGNFQKPIFATTKSIGGDSEGTSCANVSNIEKSQRPLVGHQVIAVDFHFDVIALCGPPAPTSIAVVQSEVGQSGSGVVVTVVSIFYTVTPPRSLVMITVSLNTLKRMIQCL